MRVLIVDDEPDDLKEMEYAISSSKAPDGEFYEVVAIHDYKDALKIIETEPFDIVITDMLMGEKGDEGVEVLEQLANRSAVAIVITGHQSIPNCVQAMRAGAWDYIEKNPQDGADPFARLLESVRKACEYRLNRPERGVADSEWVHKHLSELMEKYPGRLVAVLYERVVDYDTSFAELSERVRSKFPLAKPTIISIPDPNSEDI